jgi:chromosome segregation ATPase
VFWYRREFVSASARRKKKASAIAHVTKTSMADQMGVIVPVEEFKRIQETNTLLQKKMEEQEKRTNEIQKSIVEAQTTQTKLLGEMKTMNRTNAVELQSMQKTHARDMQKISETHMSAIKNMEAVSATHMSAIKNMEAVIRTMVSEQHNERKAHEEERKAREEERKVREEERKAQEHKRQLHAKVQQWTSRLTKAKLIEKGRTLGLHGIRTSQSKADLVQLFHNHADVLERKEMLPAYVPNAYF